VSEKIYDTVPDKLVTDEEDQVGPSEIRQITWDGGERNRDEGNFELHRGGEKKAAFDRRRARGGRRLLCAADDYR